MNEVELVFYGQKGELESSVLQKTGIVHYRPATEALSGLFAVEKRYGSEIRKPLSADILGDRSEADWIIYRYLSPDEERAVRENKSNKKIYVLLHNYYSFQHLFDGLLKENINQYSLIVDRFNPEIKSIHDVNPVIKTKNYFNISKPKIAVKKESEKASFDFSLRVMLAALARILLNPVNELNRYSILMRYSQARVLIRLLELFSFIFFLLAWCFHRGLGVSKVASIKAWFLARHVTLMSAFRFYGLMADVIWGFYHGMGVSKVASIKAWFFARHVALMSAFRFYGLMVDVIWGFYHAMGVSKVASIKGWFLARHVALMSAFKFYGLLVDTLAFVYFRMGGWLLKNAVVPVYNFVKFSVRHVIIIAAVKTYGALVDVSLFLYRILKLYFLVPVFIDFSGWLWRMAGEIYRLLGLIYAAAGVPVLNFFKFKVRHVLIIASAKTYGFLYDVLMWSDRWIRLPLQNFLKFTVRHFFLMLAYKTYGLVVDTVLFGYRIGKLYLMYPLFKIYWFTSFQYKKRIKKFFA